MPHSPDGGPQPDMNEPPHELEALLRAETELAQRSHAKGKGEERVLNWGDRFAEDFREFWGTKAPQQYVRDHYGDSNKRWIKPVANEWKRFLAKKRAQESEEPPTEFPN